MRTLTLVIAILAFALVVSGCLYMHTVMPLTTNHLSTPVTETEGKSDIKHIQLPFQYSYLGVMWGDAALGDIAREKGLQELYYADLEYLSVLTIWRQYTVHLYGR